MLFQEYSFRSFSERLELAAKAKWALQKSDKKTMRIREPSLTLVEFILNFEVLRVKTFVGE